MLIKYICIIVTTLFILESLAIGCYWENNNVPLSEYGSNDIQVATNKCGQRCCCNYNYVNFNECKRINSCRNNNNQYNICDKNGCYFY